MGQSPPFAASLAAQQLQSLAQASPAISFVVEADGRISFANARWRAYFGFDFTKCPEGWLHAVDEKDRARVRQAWDEATARGESMQVECRARREDGGLRWQLAQLLAVRGAGGDVTAWLGTFIDVHDTKAAQEELASQRLFFQQVIDSATTPIWVKDLEGRYLLSNAAHHRLVRRPLESVVGRSDADFGYDAPTVAAWVENDRAVARSGVPATLEEEVPDAEQLRTFISVKYPLRDAAGTVYAVGGVAAEVTEHLAALEAAEAARRSAEHQRLFFDAVLDALPVGVVIGDAQGRLVKWNRATLELFGSTDADYTSTESLQDFGRWKAFSLDGKELPPEQWPMARALLKREVVSGERLEIQRLDGQGRRAAMFMGSPVLDATGTLLGAVIAQADVTDSVRAEQALRESELRLRAMADNIPQMAWMADEAGRLTWYNRRFLEYTGLTFDELKDTGWKQVQHPEHLEGVVERWTAAVANGAPWEDTLSIRGADGRYRSFLSRATPIRNAEGRVVQWFGSNTDVTEQLAAEEQLRQVQRLQAVSHLAGGMAHELNNLLCASIAFDGFALESLPPAHPAAQDVGESLKAQQRAAKILQQVLTFSRRAHFQRSRFDVAGAVQDFAALLRQSLAPHGSLRLMCGEAVPVYTDRVQLEQALLNLVLNARDAMTQEGIVTITTGQAPPAAAPPELPPGRYGFVRVQDTGGGMAPEVAARAFEPFFTTKDIGQGTGLGLSQVYGFAKQSDGTVAVETRPGQGTTVTIWLPLDEQAAAPMRPPARADAALLPKLVLVVDDEPLVRALVRRVLQANGFVVQEADSGAMALEQLEVALRGGLCCVVCDVLMPEMSGEATVAAIRKSAPELPVLFISGYPGVEELQLPKVPNAAFLSKPFHPQALLQQVRALVGQSAPTV